MLKPGASSVSPIWVLGIKPLGQHMWLFLTHQQEAGSEMQNSGLESAPIWDTSTAGSSFTCHLPQKLTFKEKEIQLHNTFQQSTQYCVSSSIKTKEQSFSKFPEKSTLSKILYPNKMWIGRKNTHRKYFVNESKSIGCKFKLRGIQVGR